MAAVSNEYFAYINHSFIQNGSKWENRDKQVRNDELREKKKENMITNCYACPQCKVYAKQVNRTCAVAFNKKKNWKKMVQYAMSFSSLAFFVCVFNNRISFSIMFNKNL